MNNSILFFFSLLLINSALAGTKKIPVGQTVDDCLGIEDGDYQSPDGCHYYVTCSNNHIERKRPCPVLGDIILEWDDKLKKCVYYSETCPDVPGPTPTFPPTKDTPSTPDFSTPTQDPTGPTPTFPPTKDTPTPTFPPTKGPDPTPSPTCGPDNCDPCITKCTGKPVEKQKYQSCNGCDVYATCEYGWFIDNIPCCEGKHFDDNLKKCVAP